MGGGGQSVLWRHRSTHGDVHVDEPTDVSDAPVEVAERRRSVLITPASEVLITPASNSENVSQTRYTVFLLRHGEAAHNVLEKRAKDDARARCTANGLDPGSKETLAAMEEARMAVLEDDGMADPSLSAEGRRCGCETRARIDELSSEQAIPVPTRVLVSPLQRTLQTAALVFQGHANVRACEELCERRTGLACDQRSPARTMCKRPTFVGIDFEQVLKIDDGPPSEPAGGVEDKAMLRTRTLAMLGLLEDADDTSIALVTHKGYLRELERGPLCQAEATECANGEVRVYRVITSHSADGTKEIVASRLA